MKKLLLLVSLTFLPLPAQAITWNQFWRPFVRGSYYYQPYQPYYSRPYYVPMCNQTVYREEYIPGNYWTPGYVRRWNETVRVPCDGY